MKSASRTGVLKYLLEPETICTLTSQYLFGDNDADSSLH